MSGTVQTILAELRRRFEALYRPRLVQMLLYGSQARADAEPGSDIIDRFPEDFMFRLTANEASALRFQIGMSKSKGLGYDR